MILSAVVEEIVLVLGGKVPSLGNCTWHQCLHSNHAASLPSFRLSLDELVVAVIFMQLLWSFRCRKSLRPLILVSCLCHPLHYFTVIWCIVNSCVTSAWITIQGSCGLPHQCLWYAFKAALHCILFSLWIWHKNHSQGNAFEGWALCISCPISYREGNFWDLLGLGEAAVRQGMNKGRFIHEATKILMKNSGSTFLSDKVCQGRWWAWGQRSDCLCPISMLNVAVNGLLTSWGGHKWPEYWSLRHNSPPYSHLISRPIWTCA